MLRREIEAAQDKDAAGSLKSSLGSSVGTYTFPEADYDYLAEFLGPGTEPLAPPLEPSERSGPTRKAPQKTARKTARKGPVSKTARSKTARSKTARAFTRVADLLRAPYSTKLKSIAENVKRDHVIHSQRTLKKALDDEETRKNVGKVTEIFRRLLSSGDSSDAAKNARSPSKVAAECALAWAKRNGYSELAKLISAQRGGRRTRRRKRRRRSRSRGKRRRTRRKRRRR